LDEQLTITFTKRAAKFELVTLPQGGKGFLPNAAQQGFRQA